MLNLSDTDMNIVFFGSSQFAVPSLKALLATQQKISCVVTQPDKQKGRGLNLGATAVKTVAKEFNLGIYQPPWLNTSEVIKSLKDLSPDLFIVVSYGQLLSQEVLDIPKIFAINVHASLLPKYRGAAPINWTIINGEKITGVTIIKMVKEMDAGPIILQKAINISDDDTAITLEDNLSRLAAQLLFDSLNCIENNNYKLTLQDEGKVSFAPKLKKEDGLINWNNSAQDICSLVRGCLNWPGAFTYYKGKLLKIYKAKVSRLALPALRVGTPPVSPVRKKLSNGISQLPGEVIEAPKQGVTVVTGKGNLIIEELQIEGKRRMKVEEFISGHKISPGDRLGYP